LKSCKRVDLWTQLLSADRRGRPRRKLIERRQFMALLVSAGLLCRKRTYPDIGRIEIPQRSEVMTWPSPDRTPGLQRIRLRGEPGPVEGFQTIAEKKKREQEEILLPFLVPWSLTTWPPLGIRDALAGGLARRLGLPNGIEVSAEPATTINTNSYVERENVPPAKWLLRSMGKRSAVRRW
jgi:hypothetical protein